MHELKARISHQKISYKSIRQLPVSLSKILFWKTFLKLANLSSSEYKFLRSWKSVFNIAHVPTFIKH